MFNSTINKLAGNLPNAKATDGLKVAGPDLKAIDSLSEQDFSEPERTEPAGVEETMLSPVPPKPVDVKVWTSQIKNPA